MLFFLMKSANIYNQTRTHRQSLSSVDENKVSRIRRLNPLLTSHTVVVQCGTTESTMQPT